MLRWYETAVIQLNEAQFEGQTFYHAVGVQILAAPPEVDGVAVNYESVVSDLSLIASITNEGQLAASLALVTNPTMESYDPSWIEQAEEWADTWEKLRAMRESFDTADLLMLPLEELVREPIVAAEASPLNARSLRDLLALATSGALVLVGGAPAIVLIGTAIGVVVIRGLSAVGAPIWKGAQPHLEAFGGDVAAWMLDGVRNRLGISQAPPPSDDRARDRERG